MCSLWWRKSGHLIKERIDFVIFLNGKKELTVESDEMFKDYSFNQIRIITQNDDIDFGNGLKITNIIISANS